MAHPPSLSQLSRSPIFNTKAVARETGVPADTFRAWERRYGIPHPQRTPGGHRLYSERDMAIIRWLRERTEEGMNISHAVMLLTNTLDMPPAPPIDREAARPIERIAEDVVLALTHFDLQRAELLIGEAFAIYPFEQVLLGLIQPAMVEIGERWHRGEINVAAEHFATQFVRRKLAGLLNIFENSAQRATIVVGCGPGELHDLGILLIALFLVRRGWHVVYLGPQLPLADLIETIGVVKPGLVCLSASTAETAVELVTVARGMLQAFPQVHFGYGGRVFNSNPELRRAMPGTFLGHNAREVVETIETLLRRHSTFIPE
jgi:MerR family transcriptional regulator, light-induced transcriptional regulator